MVPVVLLARMLLTCLFCNREGPLVVALLSGWFVHTSSPLANGTNEHMNRKKNMIQTNWWFGYV